MPSRAVWPIDPRSRSSDLGGHSGKRSSTCGRGRWSEAGEL